MEIDFDAMANKCSGSKLRPSFRVASVVVTNDNAASLRANDDF
jgi:hypothetical protein